MRLQSIAFILLEQLVNALGSDPWYALNKSWLTDQFYAARRTCAANSKGTMQCAPHGRMHGHLMRQVTKVTEMLCNSQDK